MEKGFVIVRELKEDGKITSEKVIDFAATKQGAITTVSGYAMLLADFFDTEFEGTKTEKTIKFKNIEIKLSIKEDTK